MIRQLLQWVGLLCVLLAVASCDQAGGSPGAGSVQKLRIARQYGVGYLPFLVLEKQDLIAKAARAQGLGEVQVEWIEIGSGAAATDGLLSGSLDYAGTGVAPLITAWSKTGGQIRGVAALSAAPMYFNTSSADVHSVKDLTEKDRIALPSVKVSIQAVMLQIAAAQAFGDANYAKLDPLTVSLKHPDAAAALLAERSEITGHVTNEPFAQLELANPRIHTVFKSYDLLGGPHTHVVVLTTESFRDRNPKLHAVFVAALQEAIDLINRDRDLAARIYVESGQTKESLERALAQLNDPDLRFTTTPLGVTKFSDFMARVQTIKAAPASWKDLFFPEIHEAPGS